MFKNMKCDSREIPNPACSISEEKFFQQVILQCKYVVGFYIFFAIFRIYLAMKYDEYAQYLSNYFLLFVKCAPHFMLLIVIKKNQPILCSSLEKKTN